MCFTRYTGPLVDHTYGNDQGYYLYIEASGGTRKQGEKAWLVTEHIASSSVDHCFTLWYHMYGNSIGNLSVYQSVYDPQKGGWDIPNKLFTAVGDHGDFWQQAFVDIPSDLTYYITVEGTHACILSFR